jgi:hypothetical protein
MSPVGLELTTSVLERAKTVHAIGYAATVFDRQVQILANLNV